MEKVERNFGYVPSGDCHRRNSNDCNRGTLALDLSASNVGNME